MLKLVGTCSIHSISPIIEIPSKNGGQPFVKRELILDDSFEKDGNFYPRYVKVDFIGENMAKLDSLAPEMKVNVEVYLNSREYNQRLYYDFRNGNITPLQAQQPMQAPQGYTQTQQAPQQAPFPGVPSYAPYSPNQAPGQPAYWQNPPQPTQPQSPTNGLPWK